MDAVRVALLREVLAGTEWLDATRRFAGSLRASVEPHGGGLLLVGSAEYEPWHLAAHLDDEAAWSGLPQLSPTLVRHRVRPGEPAHLAVGLSRLEAARRGETLLVVTPDRPGETLLERVHDARRAGATVLALDSGDRDLRALAHDALAVPALPAEGPPAPPGPRGSGPDRAGPGRGGSDYGSGGAVVPGTDPAGAGPDGMGPDGAGPGEAGPVGLDTVQHLVSAAAGENSLPSPRSRLRFRDRLSRLAEQLTAPPPTRW